jgi:hypothetical protein
MKTSRNLFSKKRRIASRTFDTIATNIEERFHDWLDEQADPYERKLEDDFEDPTDMIGDTFSTYLIKYYSVVSDFVSHKRGSEVDVFNYVIDIRYNKFCLDIVLKKSKKYRGKYITLVSIRKSDEKFDVKKLEPYRLSGNAGWELFTSSQGGSQLLKVLESDIEIEADDFRQEIEEM